MAEDATDQGLNSEDVGQVDGDVEQSLLPPALAKNFIEPNKAPVGEHALLEFGQAAVDTKHRAVAQAAVVKLQLVVPAGQVDA